MWNPIRRFKAWLVEGRQQMERIEREIEEWKNEVKQEILPLSIEEAQRRAEPLLADRTRFRCRISEDPITPAERLQLDSLAPVVRAFFERFFRVDIVSEPDVPEYYEGAAVGDEHLALWLNPEDAVIVEPGFIPIGSGGLGPTLIVVKKGEEPIYYLEESAVPSQADYVYPSIYHYLLAADRYFARWRDSTA